MDLNKILIDAKTYLNRFTAESTENIKFRDIEFYHNCANKYGIVLWEKALCEVRKKNFDFF